MLEKTKGLRYKLYAVCSIRRGFDPLLLGQVALDGNLQDRARSLIEERRKFATSSLKLLYALKDDAQLVL